MVDDNSAELVLSPVGLGLNPGGELRVPDEGVAAEIFAVLLREGGNNVALGIVEDALLWFGEEPLLVESMLATTHVAWRLA